MADFKKLFPRILDSEGRSYENVPGDNGGPTKMGIILSEWKVKGYDKNKDGKIDENDLKLITEDDAYKIYKINYWDVIRGDEINNQVITEFICDWGVNCGIGLSVRKVQSILGLEADGKFGPKTLESINKANQKDLFNKLVESRTNYYNAIVQNHPVQSKFLKGWLNRTNSFKFKDESNNSDNIV
jgi:lysozyme family protein